MSHEMSTMVTQRFPFSGNDKLLALVLANYAHPDGTHIFPGVQRLAKNCCVSERTIIRLLSKFEQMGWLIKVTQGNVGRGIANEYIINPAWIAGEFELKKGDSLSPFTAVDEIENSVDNLTERVTNEEKRVTNRVLKGDIAVSPQIYNHYINNTPPTSQNEISVVKIKQMLAPLGITFYNQSDTVEKWVTQKLSENYLLDCVKSARINKPLPQRIPANYLDSIIQSRISEMRVLPAIHHAGEPSSKPKGFHGTAWLLSDHATIAKGIEIAMPPLVGETIAAYRERLKKALAEKNQVEQTA